MTTLKKLDNQHKKAGLIKANHIFVFNKNLNFTFFPGVK